jgi:prepilin-type N-terminal cleavage/methylation domain-containing protein
LNRISKGVSEGRGRAACTLKGKGKAGGQGGFTLIELLAVIAIIALLAGIVLGTSGIAIFKSRESRMRAEHGRIVTAIESYKLELGNYPPDNQTLGTMDRHERAGKNSLYYELSGCTFENADGGTFVTQNQSERIKAADLRAAFGVKGVDNSARSKRDVPWKGVSFKPNQFAELNGFEDAEILITPLPGPHELEAKAGTSGTATKKVNPWFYDASSTNRNNPESFDLWSEYKTRDGNKVIGNWKY